MPHIIRRVERAGKRDRKFGTVVRTATGPEKTRKGIRLIHGRSGMLFEGKQVRAEADYTMLLDTAGIVPEAGDELYELKERWQPSFSSCPPGECLQQYGWCIEDKEAISETGGIAFGDIRIREDLVKKTGACIQKYSCTEGGCSIPKCIRTVPVPPFIIDIYLESQNGKYRKVGNRIYQRGFEYRDVLSPFTAHILKRIETEEYIHMKEFSRMKNADNSLMNLEVLGYIVIYNDLYILSRDKADEIPRVVHKARNAEPDISLSSLADVAGVPKKVLLLILQNNE